MRAREGNDELGGDVSVMLWELLSISSDLGYRSPHIRTDEKSL